VPATAAYIPHGGGPLPLLGDPGHADLVRFLRGLFDRLGSRPGAVIVVSAHWEEAAPTVTSAAAPPLIYDYGGFPPEAYTLRYPSPGDPGLADRIVASLRSAGLPARRDAHRGFDHGHFVPMTLIAPAADVPCVQLSLVRGLDPAVHLDVGRALRALAGEDVLLLGSGLSFHNLGAFFGGGGDAENRAFESALRAAMTGAATELRGSLERWEELPGARFCHPRSEHLLPLMVCAGFAGRAADEAHTVPVLGRQTSAFLWRTRSDASSA
jgi:4,5-DOPA dioxygenase extradiol